MMRDIFIDFLLQAVFSIGLVLAVGLLIRAINKLVYSMLGSASQKVAVVSGFIGTPIHELGHAAMCVIFGHKITEMKLFIPNPTNGVMGYVSHSYNKKNIYHQIGNFFIGVGPIISCGLVITLVMYLTVPQILEDVLHLINNLGISSLSEAPVVIYEIMYIALFNPMNVSNILWWIFIVINSSVALHMAISIADIKCSLRGLLYLLATMLIIDIVIGIISLSALNMVTDVILGFSSFIIALLGISLVMSAVILCVTFVFTVIKKIIR